MAQDPIDSIFRFFKQLFMSRIRTEESRVKQRIRGAEARAKSKVAASFNKGVDKAVGKAKDTAKKVAPQKNPD